MTDDKIKVIHKSTALSDDFLAEIGRIAVLFAILEHDLINLVHRLLCLPENIARTVTSEISFRGMYQLASSLVKERVPDKFVEFRTVLKQIGKAEEKRNQISHSLWGSSTSSSAQVVRTKYSAKATKGLHLSREELTVADLYAASNIISIAAYDVEAFYVSLTEMMPNNLLKPTPLRGAV